MVERRKRQRTMMDMSPEKGGLIDHPTSVPDDLTIEISKDEIFENFFDFSAGSVMGKMESYFSQQPTLATNALVPLPSNFADSISALVPSSSGAVESCPSISSIRSHACIVNRITVETSADNISLNRVRASCTSRLSHHRYQDKRGVPGENFLSFARSLLNGHGWGTIEIPVMASHSDFVYVETTPDYSVTCSQIRLAGDRNFIDELKSFGVVFDLCSKIHEGMTGEASQPAPTTAIPDSSDDEDESKAKTRSQYIRISGRRDVFGFFDFLRIIVASKPSVTLASSEPFHGSVFVQGHVDIKHGSEGKRFIVVEKIYSPLAIIENWVENVLRDANRSSSTVMVHIACHLFNNIGKGESFKLTTYS